MANSNPSIKNSQQTNVIVVTEDDVAFQTIISLVEKSNNCNTSTNMVKRVISESNVDHTPISDKRRKADLTCMICDGRCSGYNFSVISCESCKAFFYRNASENLNVLKCLNGTNDCNIKCNNKRKMCRRCRLQKCLSVGMKCASNADQRLNKQRHIEENRRLATMQSSVTIIPLEDIDESTDEFATALIAQNKSTVERPDTTHQYFLAFNDFNRINSLTRSYERAFRFSTVRYDASVFDRVTDRRSGLLHTTSIFYDMGMQLITFIRSIPEFESLNEQDRFILVKYNAPLTLYVRLCLHYDLQKELVIVSEVENEEHAAVCKKLCLYSFGNQIESLSTELFRSIKKITGDDPVIFQLMLVILTFTKSVTAEDLIMNDQPVLVNSKQVYEIQSIYTNLLFRYMLQKYSTYNQATRQYSRLIQKILQIQLLVRTYQEFLHEQLVDTGDDEINPIIKSILRL
ncbi:unnamed protein product [Adineta ricciae]|uniref:Uncharacterized protein n=1 Tax=Adineta ricciae TaxID=249248 RepID=A0A815QW30_ADIRI|nr:unnamed protein product [Adineta ricciae]CAF1602716.1 unnamed protein product [Adineta ricciae]